VVEQDPGRFLILRAAHPPVTNEGSLNSGLTAGTPEACRRETSTGAAAIVVGLKKQGRSVPNPVLGASTPAFMCVSRYNLDSKHNLI